MAREILGGAIGGDAPVKGGVLRIALAKPPGNLRLGDFVTEVESVRAIVLNLQVRKHAEWIGRDVVSIAVVNMDAVARYLDPEIAVSDGGGYLQDLLRFGSIGSHIVQTNKTSAVSLRNTAILACPKHEPSRGIMFFD